MRKLLLLCAIMFSTIGAWAQETRIGEPITVLTSGKYVLVCKSDKGVGPAYFNQSGQHSHYRYDLNKSSVTSGSIIDNPNLYVWQVDVLQNGKITIKLANDHTKYFPKDNNKNENFMGTEIAELTPEVKTIDGINYILLKYDEEIGYIHVNAPGGNPVFSYWPAGETSATCVKFQFHPVGNLTYTLTDDAENQYIGRFSGTAGESIPSFTGAHGYSLTDGEWSESTYRARIHFTVPVSKADASADRNVLMNPFTSDNSLRYFVDGNNVKVHTLSDNTINNNDLWSIYPEFNDGSFTFVIKNYGTGRYVKVNKTESSASKDDAGAVTVVDAFAEATKFTLAANNKFKLPNRDLYMSVTSSTTSPQYVTVHTASGHNGCDIYFPEVSNEMVGKWKGGYKGCLGYVGGYPTSSAEDLELVTDYAEMLAFQAENEILGIDPDKYYRLVCVSPKTGNDGDTNYNTLTFDGTSNLVTAPEDNSKVSQIFNFEPVDDGKYMLVSPNTGGYLNKIGQGGYRSALVDKADACKLEIIAHSGVICQYMLHNSESTNSNHCLFAENHPGENVPYACSGWNNGANSASAWYLKVVDKLNFVIGSAGWATTHLPFDVVMPEKVNAYAVESTSAASATLTQKEDIPAGQGAILEGQGTHTLTIAKASSDWTGNKLEGTNVDEQITGSAYVLSMPEGKDVGLYPAKLTNGQFKNNANKAYLPASAVPSDARFLVFSFGDDVETGITETENGKVKTEVYDLAGRRVQNAQKGIFIVNGKKVVR